MRWPRIRGFQISYSHTKAGDFLNYGVPLLPGSKLASER
jgi:hypothetical protein